MLELLFAGVATLFIVIFTALLGMAIADRFRTPFLCFLVRASGIVAGLRIVLTALVAGMKPEPRVSAPSVKAANKR